MSIDILKRLRQPEVKIPVGVVATALALAACKPMESAGSDVPSSVYCSGEQPVTAVSGDTFEELMRLHVDLSELDAADTNRAIKATQLELSTNNGDLPAEYSVPGGSYDVGDFPITAGSTYELPKRCEDTSD